MGKLSGFRHQKAL